MGKNAKNLAKDRAVRAKMMVNSSKGKNKKNNYWKAKK
jgi:hypothetical protein